MPRIVKNLTKEKVQNGGKDTTFYAILVLKMNLIFTSGWNTIENFVKLILVFSKTPFSQKY
jgi:hypothetical protein